MTTDDVSIHLRGIFAADSKWRQVTPRLYFLEIGGRKLGAVLATWNQRYDNYALNHPEYMRLLAAKRDGRVDVAFVVAARRNGTGRLEFQSAVDAVELHARLDGKHQVIAGAFGNFWPLLPFELDDEEAPM